MSGAYSRAYSGAYDSQPATPQGSWDQLLSIYREAESELAARRATRPQACPNDGTPLTAGPQGILFCEFDGVQWPRDRALFKEANHP